MKPFLFAIITLLWVEISGACQSGGESCVSSSDCCSEECEEGQCSAFRTPDADAADAAEEPADLRRRQRLKSLSRLRQLDRGCKYRKYKCDPRSKTNYGCLIWKWGWGTKYCWHSTTTDWCWTGKIRTDKENTPNGAVNRRWVPKSAQCNYDSDCLRYAGNGCTGDYYGLISTSGVQR